MSLVQFMLRRSLGDNPLTVGLFNQGSEIVADGYQRIPVRWRFTSRSATSTVTFGPYQAQTVYDRYVLFDGDQVVDEFLEEAPVSLPRGFTWDWKPELVLG